MIPGLLSISALFFPHGDLLDQRQQAGLSQKYVHGTAQACILDTLKWRTFGTSFHVPPNMPPDGSSVSQKKGGVFSENLCQQIWNTLE
jgi:hypothetical protein